jgi:hypothetical protein
MTSFLLALTTFGTLSNNVMVVGLSVQQYKDNGGLVDNGKKIRVHVVPHMHERLKGIVTLDEQFSGLLEN